MANQGYNAGNIFVDLFFQSGNASKEIDKITRQIQQLQRREKELQNQQRAVDIAIQQSTQRFGANSREVDRLQRRMQSLRNSQQLVVNQISVLNTQLQTQAASVNSISRVFSSLGNSVTSSVAGIGNLINTLNVLKVTIAGVAAHRLYDALITPGAELEQTITSLDVLLGSYEKAQKLSDNLVKLASKTPLVTSDLTEGATQLLAVNVALEDIEGTLEMLGDVSMGSSKKFDTLVQAYSKIQSSGRAQLKNLNSFTQAGIPIIEALSESLGVSQEEFFKLSRAGQVTANDVTNALKLLTSEGGRFADMMDRQSKTYTGLLSTAADNFEILAQKIGDESLEQLKDSLTAIIEEMDRLEETGELDVIIKQWGGAIAELIKNVGSAVAFLYEFREIIIGIISGFVGWKVITFTTSALASFVAVVGSAAGPVLALVAAIGVLTTQLKESRAEAESAAQAFKDLAEVNLETNISYNADFEGIEKQRKEVTGLLNSLKSLSEQEHLNYEEKERLKDIVSDLNEIYPNLNLKYDEESGKLNRNFREMENYMDMVMKRNTLSLKLDYGSGLDKRIAETKKAMQELIDENNRLNSELEKTPYNLQNMSKRWDLSEKIEYNTELINTYIEELKVMESQNKEYIFIAEQMILSQTELGNSIKAIEENWANAAKTMDDVRADFEALVEALKEAKKEFEGIFDEAIEELDQLTDILGQEGDTLELTEAQARKLARTYPQLASQIEVTADAYTIERKAVEELKLAKVEEARAAIEAQKVATEEALEATQSRISMYNLELGAITSLAEAQQALANAQKELSENVEPDASKALAPIYSEDGRIILQESTTTGIRDLQERNLEDSKQLVTLFQQLEDSKASIAGYEKEIEIILANIESISSKSTKAGETPEEAAIRNLKYSLDMELITQQQYYDTLEKMKDKYYANGTKQWQQYTLEIYKGRKKLEEDNAKAELQAYEDRLKNSYSWIEDEEFYGRLGGQGLIDAYNRIKTYTKEYYDDGKISYERYVEEIKKLDKQIYSSMKDNLKTSNDELSDLRKKRYDEAVRQVEDYYDALEKAEEDAERDKQLRELQSQLELYEGAVTRAGQEKYKEISEDIEDIRKEGERAAREIEKQSKLEELERTYNSLEETQNAYFESVLEYSSDVTEKIQQMTQLVNSAFSSITDILSGVSGITNNNTSYQTIINQNNNINSEASGRAVVQMTDILYRYTPNRF